MSKYLKAAVVIACSLCLTGCLDRFMNGESLSDIQSGPDKDCSDYTAPIYVGTNDPYDLDRDGDGWGCESLG